MKAQSIIWRITLILIFYNSSIAFGQIRLYEDSLRFYFEKGNYDKSIIYVDKILDLYPTSTYYLLYKGAFQHEKFMYDEAIKTFSSVIQINPDLTDAYVRRGHSFLRLRKYDSSLLDFNKAIGKYRYQDSVIYVYRALAYYETGQFELAKVDYDSAIKFNGNDKESLDNRALTKIKLGDEIGALEDLNRAIAIDPNYLDALKHRITVNAVLRNIDEVLTDSKQFIKHRPLDEDVNLILGGYYFFTKEYETALKYLDKAKQLKTKEVYKLTGLAHYYLVHDKRAIENLTQVFNFDLTQAEEADMYYIIGICKNNIKPKSGCLDFEEAIKRGQVSARTTFGEDCK